MRWSICALSCARLIRRMPMRSSGLSRSPVFCLRTGVMRSSVLLRRALMRHRRGVRLRRIRLRLCLSRVGLFRGVLAL